MGFVSGRTLSSVATRRISTAAGWILNISCANLWISSGLRKDLFRANLPNRDQVRHRTEVVHREIAIAPGPNLLERFLNFRSKSLLDLPLLRELPEGESELTISLASAPTWSAKNPDRFRRSFVSRYHDCPALWMSGGHLDGRRRISSYRTWATISSLLSRHSGRSAELALTKLNVTPRTDPPMRHETNRANSGGLSQACNPSALASSPRSASQRPRGRTPYSSEVSPSPDVGPSRTSR